MGLQRAAGQHAVHRMLRSLPWRAMQNQTLNTDAYIAATSQRLFSSVSSSYTLRHRTIHDVLHRATQSHCTTHIRTFFRQRNGYTNFDPTTPVGYVLLGVGAVTGGMTVWVVVNNQQEVPYTHRKHVVLTSNTFDQLMGTQSFNVTKEQAQAAGTLLPESHKAVRRVRKVVNTIAEVAGNGHGGGYQDHLKGLKWDVVVINSPDPNAGALPGGKFVVFTGLLRLLKDEDELAAVIAHEVAHVVARHHAEQLATRSLSRFVTDVVQLVTYALTGLLLPFGIAETLLFLRYSRRQEHEADVIGMHLAAQACYDPVAGARVFTKLEQVAKASGLDKVPVYLRTHPLDQDRIRKIKDEAPSAKKEFERAGCDLHDRFAGVWGGSDFQGGQQTLNNDGWSGKAA